MATWLQLWTAAASDAGQQAHERGRIRPGLRADYFVVLDGTLIESVTIEVAQTRVAGTCVYDADRE